MFGLFKPKKQATHYEKEKLEQDRARLIREKERLGVILSKFEGKEHLILEAYDLIRYIDQHTPKGDFSCGVLLSDKHALYSGGNSGYSFKLDRN